MKMLLFLFICICGTSAQDDDIIIYPTGDLGRPENFENFVPSESLRPAAALGPDGQVLALDPLPPRHEEAVTYSKDQGRTCASCYAYAAVSVLEAKYLKKYGEFLDLSEQQLISCGQNYDGCKGGTSYALTYWSRLDGPLGPMLEFCSPFKGEGIPCNRTWCGAYRTRGAEFGEYYNLDVAKRKDDVKQSIMDDGPGYMSFRVHYDFYVYWSRGAPGSVYRFNGTAKYNGRHAVLVYGWDDVKGAWMCKNSWGFYRGPNGNGTFMMSYDQAYELNFAWANVKISPEPTPPVKQYKDAIMLRSYSYWSSFVQHNWGRIFIRTVPNTKRKEEATWYKRPGLADPSCSSFEAVSKPGHYIRQYQKALYLESQFYTPHPTNFLMDATFCQQTSPINYWDQLSMFESKAEPGHFILHEYWMMFIGSNDGSNWYDWDRSFKLENPETVVL